MDTAFYLLSVVIGGVFVGFGIYVIVRKRARVSIGGGRTGSSGLALIDVRGRGAVLLGWLVVIGGTLFGLRFMFDGLADALAVDFLRDVPVIGVVMIIAGIFVSPLFSNPPIDMTLSPHHERRDDTARMCDKGDEMIVLIDDNQDGFDDASSETTKG